METPLEVTPTALEKSTPPLSSLIDSQVLQLLPKACQTQIEKTLNNIQKALFYLDACPLPDPKKSNAKSSSYILQNIYNVLLMKPDTVTTYLTTLWEKKPPLSDEKTACIFLVSCLDTPGKFLQHVTAVPGRLIADIEKQLTKDLSPYDYEIKNHRIVQKQTTPLVPAVTREKTLPEILGSLEDLLNKKIIKLSPNDVTTLQELGEFLREQDYNQIEWTERLAVLQLKLSSEGHRVTHMLMTLLGKGILTNTLQSIISLIFTGKLSQEISTVTTAMLDPTTTVAIAIADATVGAATRADVALTYSNIGGYKHQVEQKIEAMKSAYLNFVEQAHKAEAFLVKVKHSLKNSTPFNDIFEKIQTIQNAVYAVPCNQRTVTEARLAYETARGQLSKKIQKNSKEVFTQLNTIVKLYEDIASYAKSASDYQTFLATTLNWMIPPEILTTALKDSGLPPDAEETKQILSLLTPLACRCGELSSSSTGWLCLQLGKLGATQPDALAEALEKILRNALDDFPEITEIPGIGFTTEVITTGKIFPLLYIMQQMAKTKKPSMSSIQYFGGIASPSLLKLTGTSYSKPLHTMVILKLPSTPSRENIETIKQNLVQCEQDWKEALSNSIVIYSKELKESFLIFTLVDEKNVLIEEKLAGLKPILNPTAPPGA